MGLIWVIFHFGPPHAFSPGAITESDLIEGIA